MTALKRLCVFMLTVGSLVLALPLGLEAQHRRSFADPSPRDSFVAPRQDPAPLVSDQPRVTFVERSLFGFGGGTLLAAASFGVSRTPEALLLGYTVGTIGGVMAVNAKAEKLNAGRTIIAGLVGAVPFVIAFSGPESGPAAYLGLFTAPLGAAIANEF